MTFSLTDHWLDGVTHCPSPFCDDRTDLDDISLLVIHNISLPPAQFGGPYVEQLFMGDLNPEEHPYFANIAHLQVSAHCFVRRDGSVIQFVPFNRRAWHAGVSQWKDRERCNDFSIGIELEGTDNLAYTDAQYQTLVELSQTLLACYPRLARDAITGHEFIAPIRKTDPGVAFDWVRYKSQLPAPALIAD